MTRILITGMGVCSPLGEGLKTNWENLVNPSPFPLSKGRGPTVNEGLSRACDLTRHATEEALQDARLEKEARMEIGCTVSASKPLSDGPGWVSPGVINQFVAQEFKVGGECRNIVAACATGAYAISLGASWIEQGLCDVVLAGSVEPYPHPLMQAGFHQMGVTSPEGVTRPFDKNRSGFSFGDGAGIVVLESEASAKRRRAKIYATLSGWGMGADSHSAVAFNSGGARIADVIRKTLQKASLKPQAISHVNAHGTATRLNDWIETQALMNAFGPHAEKLMISATKSATGHLLGASGAVEFIFTVLALHHQFIPPTSTLKEADPECSLDYTPRLGHPARFDHALSLSFGFGGPIGALVVSRN